MMAWNPKKLPDVLKPDEQTLLLKSFNKRYPTSLRNLCIVRLMLDAGLRISEVLALKTTDIDWMTGEIAIREGKGAKDRILWIGDELLDLLREWKKRRSSIKNTQNAQELFVTLKAGPVSDVYIRMMLDRVSKKVGIKKKVYPHLLRHTFATDIYRKTKNIRLVQKTLGHSNLSTTMIYTHIVDDDIEQAMKMLR